MVYTKPKNLITSEYYLKHREHALKYMREYQYNNREKIKQYNYNYYHYNRTKIREKQREYYQKIKEGLIIPTKKKKEIKNNNDVDEIKLNFL